MWSGGLWLGLRAYLRFIVRRVVRRVVRFGSGSHARSGLQYVRRGLWRGVRFGVWRSVLRARRSADVAV